jgi:hypothetical protein
MKRKLAITLLGIGIALMVSTDALALIRCRRTCPTLYTPYLIGGSCTCVYTGSLIEEVADQVGNETKYPTAVEAIAEPLPVCWDDYTTYLGVPGSGYGNSCDDINYWKPEGCICPTESKTEYEVIISCGAPGNKNPAYGQNKVPYLSEWKGYSPVSKQNIDRYGIARLLLNLAPPQELIDWIIANKICSNPNWHIEVLPLRISATTIDIVAIKGDCSTCYMCYERSVAVDYFELHNPDYVFPDRNLGWVECVAWQGEYTRDNCTATVPATYEGLGLEFYDWTKDLTHHCDCPPDIVN